MKISPLYHQSSFLALFLIALLLVAFSMLSISRYLNTQHSVRIVHVNYDRRRLQLRGLNISYLAEVSQSYENTTIESVPFAITEIQLNLGLGSARKKKEFRQAASKRIRREQALIVRYQRRTAKDEAARRKVKNVGIGVSVLILSVTAYSWIMEGLRSAVV